MTTAMVGKAVSPEIVGEVQREAGCKESHCFSRVQEGWEESSSGEQWSNKQSEEDHTEEEHGQTQQNESYLAETLGPSGRYDHSSTIVSAQRSRAQSGRYDQSRQFDEQREEAYWKVLR